MTPTLAPPPNQSSRFVRWRRIAFGFAALVTVFGLVGSYFTAERRVSGVCAAIAPGMPLDALRRLAKEKGLGLGAPAEGRNLLAEKKTLGGMVATCLSKAVWCARPATSLPIEASSGFARRASHQNGSWPISRVA